MKSRNLYKFLSLLGDFRAVFKGRMHKRYVRKQVIKQAGKANRRWLR